MDLRDNSERCLLTVDADEGGSFESPAATELIECDGDIILEPYEGMEFESEDAAKIFYDKYARQVGFVMRVMSCRRSEKDGRILARRLGCNKEGYCVSIRGKFGAVRKPRPSTREGCKAMIHVKYDKSGKWVITKFVKEHNHPLVVSPREARQTMVRVSLPPFFYFHLTSYITIVDLLTFALSKTVFFASVFFLLLCKDVMELEMIGI